MTRVTQCAYCGEPAGTRDHVIPRTYSGRRKHTGAKDPDTTVPACHECNSILGSAIYWTWDERVDHVRTTLRRRYRRIHRQPLWNDDELAATEGRLRAHIAHNQRARQILEQRLTHEHPDGPTILAAAIDHMERTRATRQTA